MYSERWSPSLRTGDVVGPIRFPLLTGDLRVQAKVASLADAGGEADSFIVPAKQRYAVVLSHDCEFNEGKRDFFLLARLQRLPHRLPEQDLADLRASNDVEDRVKQGQEVAGLDSFVFSPLAGHFEEEHVSVFWSMTPIPMSRAQDLQAVKRAELEHATRLLLRKKLGLFFVRGSEDIPDEEKKVPGPN